MKDKTKRLIVRQNHNLIEARYKLKTEEMDFILILMNKIFQNDNDFSESKITFKEYQKLTGVHKEFNRFKNLSKGLIKKFIEIENEGEWIMIPWLQSVKYIKSTGLIEAKFSEKMKPYLLNLGKDNLYIKTELIEQIKLKSFYSKRIYYMLQKYQKFGVYVVEVEKLQKMLQVPISMLNYSQFNQKVLNIALKEINEKSDLIFKYEIFKKIGKKITKIKFKICPKMAIQDTQKNI